MTTENKTWATNIRKRTIDQCHTLDIYNLLRGEVFARELCEGVLRFPSNSQDGAGSFDVRFTADTRFPEDLKLILAFDIFGKSEKHSVQLQETND